MRAACFDLFRQLGIDKVFGNPGSTELAMFRDFPSDFSYVLALQESIAIGMADGYAQARKNAALVNLHSAVGVGHAAGNIFTAYKNQTPLVITAGQQARSILPYDPFLFSQQATEFPKPYVKWSCEPARAEDVPLAIARAYYVAMQPPRGPTLVSVPADDWDQFCYPVTSRKVSQVIAAEDSLLDELAAALSTARQPVIVAGAGIARDDAWDEVVTLAEKLQAPVWVSPMSSRCSFPETHTLFAGFLAAHRNQIVSTLAGHDLILVLGAPAFTYHVEGSGPHIPDGASLYQVTDNPEVAAWAPAGTAIVSSVKPALVRILAQLRSEQRPARQVYKAAVELDGSRLTDRFLLQQLARLRSPDSIIVEEAPSSRGPMHDYLPILKKDTFYTCASGGLGHALPVAIGMAMGRPKDKVICLLGDGSAMYSIQGLWSAVQHALPITFIIVNNQRYQALRQFGALFGLAAKDTVGTDLPGIDFVELAKGMGCAAERVSELGDLDAALQRALNSPQTRLLEVLVT